MVDVAGPWRCRRRLISITALGEASSERAGIEVMRVRLGSTTCGSTLTSSSDGRLGRINQSVDPSWWSVR